MQDFWILFRSSVIEPLSNFFGGLTQEEGVVLISLMVGAIATGFLLGRARSYQITEYQNRAEALLSGLLARSFRGPDYHLMSHITLPMDGGTTQIDQILVSRFGVFVIEAKHYRGWIYGSAAQRQWTQVFYKAKFRFQNPLHQNRRHVNAVERQLDFLPPGAVKSLGVFTGDATIKTDVPQNVVYLRDVLQYIESYKEELIPIDRMHLCVGRIETARLAITRKTDVEHIQDLERRHGRTLSGRTD